MDIYGAKKDLAGNKHGPYHQERCWCKNKKDSVPDNWIKYATEADAIAAGHAYRCPFCFGKENDKQSGK